MVHLRHAAPLAPSRLAMQSPDPHPFRFDAVHASEFGGGAVLDEATFGALQELAGEDDPDLVSDLVSLFLSDSKERMSEIAKDTGAPELEPVGRAAHALKSSSANIGALAFSRVCAELEALARSEAPQNDTLVSLIEKAAVMYAEVCDALGDS